jgi:para-nitrobenzyl esterase
MTLGGALFVSACGGDQGSPALDSSSSSLDPVVQTDIGTVRGSSEGGVARFLGIPYAEPPVGPLRLRPPHRRQPASATIDALRFGPKCVQPAFRGGGIDTTRVEGAEDCLTLNIWTPNPPTGERLPVFVWIYGGGFIVGDTESYDGRLLAQQQMVVVSMNYRVGALGFMAHPDLARESAYGGSGNYGHLDQLEALRWVQRNIAAFGGDPGRVTIAGESAGGASVLALVASPKGTGLFSRAIGMSPGGYTYRRAGAEEGGLRIAAAVGCAGAPDVPACLRAVPAGDFVTRAPVGVTLGANLVVFGSVIDGDFLTRSILETFTAGLENPVPVMIGTTAYEFGTLVAAFFSRFPLGSEEDYRRALEAYFPGGGAVLETAYPLAQYASPVDAMVQLFSDNQYVCPARKLLRALAANRRAPLWRYLYTDAYDRGPLAGTGAGHGNELLYLFGAFGAPSALYDPTPAEKDMGEHMLRYFARFSATGDPNGPPEPSWPAYDPASDVYLEFATPLRTGAGFRRQQCDFWDPFLDRAL